MQLFHRRLHRLAGLLVDATSGLVTILAASSAGVPCTIEPGPGWLPEGEACDDSGAPDAVNGGCGSNPVVFSAIACGDDVLGLTWAADGGRDVDWHEIALPADGPPRIVTVAITAEFPARLLRFGVDPTCKDLPVDWVEAEPCGTAGLSVELPPGSATWFVVEPTLFDGLACDGGSFGHAYHLAVDCAPPVCPADLDGDGVIRFADLVTLLAHWGTCPEPGVPCPADGDVDRDGGVDFDDLLSLLASFGPCP